jgi:hypothetical protein
VPFSAGRPALRTTAAVARPADLGERRAGRALPERSTQDPARPTRVIQRNAGETVRAMYEEEVGSYRVGELTYAILEEYPVDTGEVGEISSFPPGAMWNASWMTDWYPRPDGRCIVVRLPNGHDWNIDGQASNCDRAEDKNHDCWCRHGEPPDLTVDKNPEPGRSTCTAGGGSIWANQGDPNEWHGFLQRGWLVVVGESPPAS